MIYGAYLINGGVYLDTSGTIAASAAKSAISSPAGDPEDDPDDVFAKLDAGAEPSS